VRWTWDARHRQRNPRPFDAAQFCAFLSAITAPTLAIDGGDSQFRVEGLDTRRRALKTATHVTIPGAGHLVHHDQPEALARLIHDHIRATQASE
jgi:pimeloyl-ACP methyl ester carboxylesterase